MSGRIRSPNPLFLSISNISIVAGIALALIYPHAMAHPFDTEGNRQRAVYWAAMCLLGLVSFGASYLARRPVVVSAERIVASWIIAGLGAAFLCLAAPVVMEVLSSR